ncbi:MAG: YihY/virulence factor BrkB family protein [Rhodothermales bacterium]|nr:YihY/virulence factor BrkB family protein [Rhodothermales bacterium]
MADWSPYLHRLRASNAARRVRKAPGYYSKGLYQQLAQKDVFLWAQAIAFKVLITIVPVIILATGVLGRVLQQEEALEKVFAYVDDFLPSYRTEQLLEFLRTLSASSAEFTILGVATLLFSAVILFTTLRIAVGNVFQEEWHENRSIVGGYLFDLRMVGQVGLFFVLTFGLTIAMQSLNQAGFEFIEQIGLDYVWVREGWRRTFKTILSVALPFLLTTAMFFQLIYFVPKPHPPKRSALLGALTTSVLWELAKYGFTLYAANLGRFDFGSGDGAGVGNVFGLIIAFVFWVYYSGIVLLIGAVVALLHEKGHRSRRQAALEEAEAEGHPQEEIDELQRHLDDEDALPEAALLAGPPLPPDPALVPDADAERPDADVPLR